MGSTRRSFTDEYQANAVSLLIDHGRAIAEVARSIGVHEMTLGNWVKKARDEGNSAEPVIEPGRTPWWWRGPGASGPSRTSAGARRRQPDRHLGEGCCAQVLNATSGPAHG